MENFDRESIDELLEIRQYFSPVKILRRTVGEIFEHCRF